MSVSISVAVSASNAAALGIGLAQDLYRLAVENPSVECQIGRVAQAFVDLNLTLGDLASALVQLQASSLSLSPLCSDLIEAVFSRIHGVQKTFWARLTDDVSSIDKLDDGSGASIAKHSVVTTKLGRLKMLFPGSAATELLTEMEWMRNTLAVLAATCRLSMTHQASQQIVSETLTSALLIYIRQIEQKLADIDDEVDDPSDDDEPITGPGSLFFSVAFTSTAKPARKRGVSPTFEKNLAASKLDAATWIYEALRDMASKSDPTEGLPSRFVEWLLGELTVAKVDVALDEDKIEPASEIVEQPTNSDNSESFPSLFSSPVLVPAATCISKEADDMAAEVTESITVVSVKHQVQQVTEGDNKSSVEVPVFTETTGVVQSINTTNHISESHLPTTESAATPKLGKEIKAGSQQMPDGPNENEITYAAKIDVQKFYDDLPPPYPYPESYATHHREPHFGIPGSFYPPVNGMSHPPPASLPGDFSNTICMQPQPAFSPANFYPLYSPYMAAQPYNDRGQASNLGFDANFNNDYHYSHPSTIGLGPGMRTFPAAPPFDPRGRPAPYSPAPSVLGKFNGSKDLDATMTTRRHHGPQSSRQNNSQNSRKIDDDRETEPAFSNVQEENYKTGVEISSESRFERAKCFPTEHRNTPTYLQNKTGKSRAVAHVSKKDDNYSDEEDNFSHFSKTRTIDTRKRAFNTRGIRNSKDDAEEQPTEKHCNNSSSHYTGTFPPPLSSPDVVTGIDYQILRSKSLSKSTSEAGAMISAAKTEGTDKSKMRPVSDKEEITDDDDDGSEYESASENISNGKTQLSDADRSNETLYQIFH
ncbi:hypothetical protein SEPCBS119000_004265 [Sporothrix epigloea]|uniref:Fungal N-terminal domain-containing protein n=1 Tax=Sporothrix epigloea TaxID=1892477 RepID=A0ABP0DV75_9PEZI